MTPYLDTSHHPDEHVREEIVTTRHASGLGTVVAVLVVAIVALALWYFVATGEGSPDTVEPGNGPAVTVETPGDLPS